jgi:hypothetical protein
MQVQFYSQSKQLIWFPIAREVKDGVDKGWCGSRANGPNITHLKAASTLMDSGFVTGLIEQSKRDKRFA